MKWNEAMKCTYERRRRLVAYVIVNWDSPI